MKNNLNALNEYLFDTLDAITNDDLEGEKFQTEMTRANMVCNVASKIIDNANTALRAARIASEYRDTPNVVKGMIGDESASMDKQRN